jgi:cyanophycin synthetase
MPKIESLATYFGPSVYADEPVVVVTLAEPAPPSAAIERLAAASAEWFRPPALVDGAPVLAAAEFLAAWALALLNRPEPLLVAAGARRTAEGVRIWLGYHHPKASVHALALGARLLTEAAALTEERIRQEIAQFVEQTRLTAPDFQAAILIRHARAVGLPWVRAVTPGRVWQFGQGARSAKFFESQPMQDSFLGLHWAKDKEATKRIFAELGAPVAPGVVLTDAKELPRAAEAVGFPCVVKPLDRGRSIGVTTYVADLPGLQEAFRIAAKESRAVMIERHVEGEVHRLMVLRGKFWKAVRRNRPAVVGDGRQSVSALLRALNEARRRPGAIHPLVGPVPEDQDFLQTLRSQGLTPADVPAAGRRVRVRNIPLLATGADYDDITASLHPETRAMCESLADYFGIKACGLDFITEDITRSCHEAGVFLELNGSPGLRVPIIAGVSPDEVAQAVLGDKVGRVPTLLILAPSARHEQLRAMLPTVPHLGWACGALAGVGALRLSGARVNVHHGAATVLRHRQTRCAVIIADAADLRKHGLPLDRCDRAVFFDEPGLTTEWTELLRRRSDECEATADLARVKALCAELVQAGAAVPDAAD